jgi:3-oxoacyl-[acyl-carrier protein] reductase
LAADGAAIVVNALQDRDAADAVAKEIEAAGGRAHVHMADVTKEDEATALAQAAVDAFGRLDILVCNAAIRRQQPFLEIPFEEWKEVLAVDLDGPFLCARAAIPHMLEAGGGRVITIGGSTLHILTPERAHVSAAKMGLLGLTRTIAIEFGDRGITANCVAPGHMDTVRGPSAGKRSSGGLDRPIKRLGRMDEIAAMVRHLCRPEGAYITGQCLHVNGGMYLAGA